MASVMAFLLLIHVSKVLEAIIRGWIRAHMVMTSPDVEPKTDCEN